MRGGFEMAIRRSGSNCAAWSVGIALGTDVSHKSVTKYEILQRTAQVASDRAFICASSQNMTEHAKEGASAGWKFRMAMVQGDATNATVWQRSKLHSSEATLVYTPDPIPSGPSSLETFAGSGNL